MPRKVIRVITQTKLERHIKECHARTIGQKSQPSTLVTRLMMEFKPRKPEGAEDWRQKGAREDQEIDDFAVLLGKALLASDSKTDRHVSDFYLLARLDTYVGARLSENWCELCRVISSAGHHHAWVRYQFTRPDRDEFLAGMMEHHNPSESVQPVVLRICSQAFGLDKESLTSLSEGGVENTAHTTSLQNVLCSYVRGANFSAEALLTEAQHCLNHGSGTFDQNRMLENLIRALVNRILDNLKHPALKVEVLSHLARLLPASRTDKQIKSVLEAFEAIAA